MTPVGGGRRVFPFARLVARVVAPAGSRGTCEATFSDFDARVRARLAELRCEAPAEPRRARRGAEEDARRVGDGPDLRARLPPGARGRRPPRTDAPRPVLQVTVLAGTATQPAYTIESPTVLVGRGVEPVDQAGRVRRNHVAFVEEADEVAETVGRAHARFTWDAGRGRVPRLRRGQQQRHARAPRRREHQRCPRAIRAACACGRATRSSSAVRGYESRCARSRLGDPRDDAEAQELGDHGAMAPVVPCRRLAPGGIVAHR